MSRSHPRSCPAARGPAACALLLALALAGCSDDDSAGTQDGGVEGGTSSDELVFTGELTDGSSVPPRHKCPMSVVGDGTGDNLSPPLAWAGAPEGTESFALVLEDSRYGFFHWALWDIPGDTRELPEGIAPGFEVSDPAGARQVGRQADAPRAYYGPCSDPGLLAGVYTYRLYALEVASLELTAEATGAEIIEAAEAAALDSVVWEADPE